MKTLLIGAIRLYQRLVSPLLPPHCIHQPSCSQYAAEAVMKHGAVKGGCLSMWRLLRCNPLSRGGYDPVP